MRLVAPESSIPAKAWELTTTAEQQVMVNADRRN